MLKHTMNKSVSGYVNVRKFSNSSCPAVSHMLTFTAVFFRVRKHHICWISVKYCRIVACWEGFLCINSAEASLAHSTISHHNHLHCLFVLFQLIIL